MLHSYVSPFQGEVDFFGGSLTQGVALGCYAPALQADDRIPTL